MHIETEMKKAARRGVRVGGPSLKMQVSKRDAGLWQGSKQAKKENRKEEEFRGARVARQCCRDRDAEIAHSSGSERSEKREKLGKEERGPVVSSVMR